MINLKTNTMKTSIYIKSKIGLLLAPIFILLLLSAAPVKENVADKEPIRLGFIPLTDCAPIVMAKELGLFEKYGVNVIVSKEASWANVRDKILTGEL